MDDFQNILVVLIFIVSYVVNAFLKKKKKTATMPETFPEYEEPFENEVLEPITKRETVKHPDFQTQQKKMDKSFRSKIKQKIPTMETSKQKIEEPNLVEKEDSIFDMEKVENYFIFNELMNRPKCLNHGRKR